VRFFWQHLLWSSLCHDICFVRVINKLHSRSNSPLHPGSLWVPLWRSTWSSSQLQYLARNPLRHLNELRKHSNAFCSSIHGHNQKVLIWVSTWFLSTCELLWGKWCPSFPSDPLSNEHLSSPIHPTTPAHKFSLSESLSPIPHCLLADWTDPFCILLQVTFTTFSAVSCRSFLQLECASPLTCIHCSHCCSSTEWLCLCCTSAIGSQRMVNYSWRSFHLMAASVVRSPPSRLPDPSRSSSLQKDLLPIMNLRSGFKKGRNSNILGSISMINMRSMSRWSTPQLSF